MADYISREAVNQIIAAQCGECADTCLEFDGIQPDCNQCLLHGAKKAIESIPAADVRPVILCRDCKHKGWVQEPEHGKSVDYCRLIERCVDKQFFCAAGERKTKCGARMEES